MKEKYEKKCLKYNNKKYVERRFVQLLFERIQQRQIRRTHQVPLMLEEWIRRIGLRRKIDEVLNLKRAVASLVVSEK